MGFKHVEAALQAQLPHQTGIEMSTLKLVLIAVCQHADNESNYCFPSARRLARMTHLSKSTCAKAVEYLNCMGCFLNYAKGAGHGSSSYIIDLERIKNWSIDWDSVRQADSKDDDEGVHVADSGKSEEPPSVRVADVASVQRTQRPRGSTQSPSGEPNLSFDRSVVPSEKSVKGDLRSPRPESQDKQAESVKVKTASASGVGARTTPTAKPDVWGVGSGNVCCRTWDEYQVHGPGCPSRRESLVGRVDEL
jgi:hypothetical protein